MAEQAIHPETDSPVATIVNEGDMWMPPGRMWRYQLAKAVGGLLVAAIFVGWLLIQWSNPVMRVMCIVLIAITAWVVYVSIREDVVRGRGRQLRLTAERMTIVGPGAQHVLRLSDINAAQWREDTEETAGLWFYDEQNHMLAHLDTAYLGDQSEARAFLNWARQRARMDFDVRWPSV
jgi:hypothetical protein